MSGIRQQQRSSEGWRALLARFACSGMTVTAFCQHESISSASFYRWRTLLGSGPDVAQAPVMARGRPFSALPPTPTPTPTGPGGLGSFVDLGPLLPPSSSPSFELHLDLGGGLTLHLVRH